MPASLVDIDQTFLPRGQLRLISRVIGLTDDLIICETDIDDHWTYPIHFPGDPIFPGCLLIEIAAQATLLWAWAAGDRGRPRMAKATAEFHDPVSEADRLLTIQSRVKKRRHLYFGQVEITSRGRQVASIAMVVAVTQKRTED